LWLPAVLFCRNNGVPNKRNIYVDNVYELIYTLIKYIVVFGDEDMDISEKIKELRKKTGLSQSKFSAKFGIPVRTLQQWEQGISAPPEYLVRMMVYIMLLEEKSSIQDEEPIRGKNADGK
jgi:DNA-binding XRE family transcriptional regulator